MTEVLTVATKEKVALLTLKRPEKLNALSNELLAAINAVLEGIELDLAVRVVDQQAGSSCLKNRVHMGSVGRGIVALSGCTI